MTDQLIDSALAQARDNAAAELARLEAQIAEKRDAARSGVIAQVRSLMSEHGLTPADIAPPKVARSAVAPKYRNPADATQTWAGRGKRPAWLQTAVADGRALGDFLIAA